MATQLVTDEAVRAAYSLKAELDRARAEGFYVTGWYSYMNRQDVEKVVDFVLKSTKRA